MRRRCQVRSLLLVCVLAGCDDPLLPAHGVEGAARGAAARVAAVHEWPRCDAVGDRSALEQALDRHLLRALGDRAASWSVVVAPVIDREFAIAVERDSVAVAIVERSFFLDAEAALPSVVHDSALRLVRRRYAPESFLALPATVAVRRVALTPALGARLVEFMQAAAASADGDPRRNGPVVVRVRARGGSCRRLLSHEIRDRALPIAILADSIAYAVVGSGAIYEDVSDVGCQFGREGPVRGRPGSGPPLVHAGRDTAPGAQVVR